ncbi:hypothetical protein J6590_014912 [Homalodisca vitripennis]|nr:hypothetical protein J6590_014912 [Homalodisca vitripennis]
MRTPGPTSDSHNHNGPGPMVMGNDKKNKNTYFSRPGPPVAPGPYAFAPLAPPCRRACSYRQAEGLSAQQRLY